MESLEINTAKLVLGYLRVQKCKTAYKEFLKTSSKLRNLDYAGTKYMPTRFLGLSLEEIVAEYFEISQIIQGRLEATNYYNEHHSKSLLSGQLMYLLTKVPSSRSSTPSISYQGSQVDCMSPTYINVEATPVETLPGNTENDHTFVQSPIRKKVVNGSSRSSSEDSPNAQRAVDIIDTAALAQNLMENTQFQEKIAQTINKVVEKQKKTNEADELNQTIKSAVEVAEADPLFDELLQEILDTTNSVGNNHKVSEPTNSGISTKKKDATDTSTNTKVVQEGVSDKQPILAPNNPLTNIPDNPQMPIVTYDNPLDSYIITNKTSVASVTSCVTNPMYINTLPPLIIPAITPTIRIINNPPIPSSLTEPDIMKMPIIISDDKPEPKKGRGRKKAKVLLPKQKPNEVIVDSSIQDFFKNYNPGDPRILQTVVPTNLPTTHLNNPTVRTGLKRVMYPTTSKKSSKDAVETPKENIDNTQKANVDQTNNNAEKGSDDVIEVVDSTEKINTPAPREPLKKSTPKSTSHVRNLDFSSPPKTNKQRKSSSSSKSMPSQKTEATKDVLKKTETTQKNQVAKDLFQTTGTAQKKKTLKDLPKTTETEIKTWDSDLRATVPEKLDKCPNRRKCGRKKKVVKNAKLNSTTEQEAMQLEEAIKTPVKKTEDTELSKENNENELDTSNLPENQNILNTQVKTILSPSKLHNATKNILETSKTDVTKFITPENNKPNTPWPIKANRNIMPMLETPVKVCLPTTPGVSTPLDINFSVMSSATPFTKMLEANLDMNGLDIGSIPTPLPITPSFPAFTPTMDLCSPYSNRPTDYSTGSSYYQPSDNEQNKNLEAHLREMEKASTQEASKPYDHLQMFNKNVIGKKNLNLMKKNFESDSSENGSDTEDEAEKASLSESDCDDTVIFKKAVIVVSPTKRYSLRSRALADKSISPKKTAVSTKTVKTPAKKENKKNTSKGKKLANTSQDLEIGTKADDVKTVLKELKPTTAVMKGITTSQSSVLEDLAKKRQRVADSLKPKPVLPKIKKQPAGKFKIKPIAKVYTSKMQRKSESPRKRKKMKGLRTVLSDLRTSDDSDINLELSSSDDEKEAPKENKKLSIDKADHTASDVEAQNLIEGLKERGIHLMQNKSPKKKNGEDKDFVNTSAAHLETIDRDSFDMNKSERFTVINMVHDENYKPKSSQIILQNDHKVEYIGQLYLESIGAEVIIHLKQTELCTLVDMDPKIISNNTTKHDIDSGNKSESNIPVDKEQTIADKVLAKSTVDKNTNIEGNSKTVIDPITVCETVLTENPHS
ncbi:unnamed protein product [Diabrotica balteata]|uniref:Uncharacterized protein n=1 Tax=Diabrotica balteata TaxID=107213 RepID=A0A9N9T7M5_DIABA|nr:unnamed protein product [Diabrotica balteata]